MPSFQIDLPDKAVSRLQVIANSYNQNEGTSLTVEQWILLHIQELAITQELSAVLPGIQQQLELKAQQDLTAAIKAERERLIAALAG